MSTSYTLKLSPAQIDKLKSHYAPYENASKPPHAQATFILVDCRITVYHTGNVLFQGKHAQQESALWNDNPASKSNHNNAPHLTTYIGCDETGVGDYFLPLVVAACYINPTIQNAIKDLIVKDSKQLDDSYIVKTATILQQKVPYALYTLSNEKYNEFIDNGYNAHAIKAFVHNKAIALLMDRAHLSSDIDIVMDQFASKKNYKKYLKNIRPIYLPTVFEMKAEQKYIGVAAASMIARAAFLSSRKQKSQTYGVTFPLGASKSVDTFGDKFLKKFGKNVFKKNVKWHFANTKRILHPQK